MISVVTLAATSRPISEAALATLEEPRYAAAIAGRLIGLRPERVRHWLHGHRDAGGAGREQARSGRRDEGIGRTRSFASFLDLVDLLFVKRFLEHGVSLVKLQRALEEAKTVFGERHFARRDFFTDGAAVNLRVRGKAEALLELLPSGVWLVAPEIERLAGQIDFHDGLGLAERWYPLGKDGLIVLDPRVSFGVPTVRDRGVETANILDLYMAERKSVKKVAWWMNLSHEDVVAAVTFETSIAA